jgi:D-aspartate ligase
MARNTYEAYHKKAHVIAKTPMNFTAYSNILNIEYQDNLWNKDIFIKKLIEVAKRFSNKKLLLIGTNDTYVRLIVENKDILEKYYLFNYPNIDIINNLLIKDNFYQKYGDILDIPKTYIYKCNTELDIEKVNSFMYPVIIKPGDGVLYYEHKFSGQSKVYKLNNIEEVKETIKTIEESGYDDNLIIQEFIPGDDTKLFDSILYVSKDSKVWVQSFAQIGLQEHSNTGVGNLTLLINGYNEFKNNEITKKLKKFLEEINYSGIAEFDLKYDIRDNKFKIFEINPRQARSSYYLTSLGHNLVECLVDDLIYNKKRDFKILTDEYCLTFVPKKVIKKYVNNESYKQEVNKLYKDKKVVNPLKCKSDKHFKRKLWLFLRDINYNKKYKRNEW